MDERLTSGLESDLEFMCAKLEESRDALKNADIVIPYDNGGGVMGIRRNPAFDAYESLLKAYNSTLKTLKEVGGDKVSTSRLVKFETFAKTMRKTADEG